FAGLYDFEVHKKEVQGGQGINTKSNVNDGIKNFSVFAGHKFLWGKKVLYKKRDIPYHSVFEAVKIKLVTNFPEQTMDIEKVKEKAGPLIYIGTCIFCLWFFYWFASVWR
ncbi:MAG: hypothetical protein VYE03_04840, partial [Nitrospinota bacterium]|nr:hypothetical protein [Nitrospinota bacterium]